MSNITKLAVIQGIKRVALGNSSRGLKEVASDLLHEFGNSPKARKQLADMTFLAPATIERLLDCEANYKPMADTLERCFKAMNCEVSFAEVAISAQYQNQPKTEFSRANEIYDDAEMTGRNLDQTA